MTAAVGGMVGDACSTCGTSYDTCTRKVMALQGPCCPDCGEVRTHNQRELVQASPFVVMAEAVEAAASMLDSEEHRYVERFVPCPNGCTFEYAEAALVAGSTYTWPSGMAPVMVRTAGPEDCDRCTEGTVEDEDAPQVTPLVEQLREAAVVLRTLPNVGKG